MQHRARSATGVESPHAWQRLAVALAIATVGGVGMWSVVVALPAIQADFGVDRAAAALPYTFAMLGFAGGGVIMGRMADRFGIAAPLLLGALSLCVRLSRRRIVRQSLAGHDRAGL